ncbi:hypothetical protein [Streptomyces alboflavus]|uniref:hypothetical protein n=1 Tax=Streptomyces alboflavus TaxID=67267 RepID=UPI001F333B93|nr:hypothetical protein [Streptomyces alboflavus]
MHRDNGRTLYSRADLKKVHGISEPTLQNLWTDRANNGHPAAETIDGVMHWDGAVWAVWHKELQRQRAAAATTNAPNLQGDPDEEVGPAEAARVCGFADSATVSHYIKNPPEGWPDPDGHDLLPSGRQRPKWKRWRLWQYVAERKGRGHAGGRPKGRRGLAYPYQGDERLALARKTLAENPRATNAELIPQLQAQAERAYSRPTWNLILKSAREHPDED